jgi:hypothetical protein
MMEKMNRSDKSDKTAAGRLYHLPFSYRGDALSAAEHGMGASMWTGIRCVGAVVIAFTIQLALWHQRVAIFADPRFYVAALKDPFCLTTLVVLLVAIFVERAVYATSLRPRYNMRKWDLNPDGEYYHIDGRHGGSVTYTTTTWSKRGAGWFNRYKRRSNFAMKWFLGGVAVVIGAAFVPVFPVSPILHGLGLLIMLFSAFGWAIAARGYASEVGPPPVQRQGREDVDSQNVHGDRGVASASDIDRVTRRAPRSPDQRPIFED